MAIGVVFLIARFLTAALLLAAGLAKLANRDAFVRSLASTLVVPSLVTRLIGTGVPLAEIAVGSLMIGGWRIEIVSVAAAGLFATFGVFVVVMLKRAPAAGCGCFGGKGTVSPALVVRNVGLTMLALASAAFPLVWLAVVAFAILLLGTIPPTKRVLDRLAQAKASPWQAPNAAVVRE